MLEALEGKPERSTTLTEQANGLRISRSMFIGHSAGYLLIMAILIAVLANTGFALPGRYTAIFAVTTPPTILDAPVIGLVPWATMALAVLGAIIWTDLTVRRRHDRGRSGTDAVIFQILLMASIVIHTFAQAPDIVGWLDALLVLFGLYLFVVLVLLPGTPGDNRYGAKPRPS